ncbi:MAG TPA: hypothetical protein VK196_14845, partial [Magnetospirillum sp.]|nr:hypothetical protein [Magnetospirillum sp.]
MSDSHVIVALGRESDIAGVIERAGLDGGRRLERAGDDVVHVPAWDLFRAGHALARETLEQAAPSLAPLLDLSIGGAGFRRALLVKMAYGAMSAEAPALSAAASAGAKAITLIGGAASEAAASRLSGRPVRTLAAAPSLQGHLKALDAMARPWWRLNRAPVRGGMLAILGGASEIPAIEAAIKALPPGMGVVVLLKTDRPLPEGALACLAARPHVVVPLAQAARGLVGRRLVAATRAALARQFGPLANGEVLEGLPATLAGIAGHALGTAKWALALNGLVAHYRPRLIVGALEKTIHGPILSDLRHGRDFKVINLQHAVIAHSGVLAHMSFDAFATWGGLFSRACADDGYGPTDSLVEIGNPAWLDLAQAGPLAATDATIALLPQPSGKGYVTPAVLQALYGAVLSYVQARPHVRLLVKPHPADPGDPGALYPGVEELRAAGRLEVLPAHG